MTKYQIGIQREGDFGSAELAEELGQIKNLDPESIASSGGLTQVDTEDIGLPQAQGLIGLLNRIRGITKIGSNPAIEGLTKEWSPSDNLY